MIESPAYYKTEGNGKLYVGRYNFKVEFQVFLINQDCVIYCKMDKSPDLEIDIDYSTNWSLKGFTKDKRSFFATHLMITELNSGFIELITNNRIIIGDYFDFAADKIVYPLANLFYINFETNIYDFKISLKSERRSIKKNISNYWGIPQVGAKLILEKNNEPIDSYTKIANYILQLLSIGSGRHLAISIQNFFYESKRYTLLQNNQMSSNYISPLLLQNEYPNLLKEGIPILKSWSIDKFKDLRIIQHYLNSTDRGFVDDRILKLIQCYEIIAHNWIHLDYKISSELLNLKKKIKITIKEWKQEFPEYDITGFWSGRIHKSLEWEKTVKLLEKVLLSQNLDLQKLNVDFNKLVELRHAVAHKGRFGKVDALNELINGQYALRIFLLKTFNYNGKIRENKKTGWTNFTEISELIKASA
jgi:hypothetical protein